MGISAEHRESVSEMRPFIGILMTHDDIEYVIPLTSPKDKHKNMKNTMDFHKINGGKWGAINFNHMFPYFLFYSATRFGLLTDYCMYSHLLMALLFYKQKDHAKQETYD